MKIESTFPFDNFVCYKNHHKKMNRTQVCLVNKITKDKTTILYSKFLMSIKLGRILTKEEEVDHIDNDKTNDSLENLSLISRKENKEKFFKTQKRTMIALKCPECSCVFEREKRQTHLVKGGRLTCCSRRCSGRYQFR
jgi:hypothetical protein